MLLIAALTIAATACGKGNSTESVFKDETESVTETETIQESEIEVTPQEITLQDLKPLTEAGIITGIKDLKIEKGTDVDLNELVFVDDTIVTGVDIDDSKVDYSKAGSYEAIYTITFDGEALRDYLDENKLTVKFDTEGDTVIVVVTITVEILTEEETETALKTDKTDVVTADTKADIQSSNKSNAVSAAKQSTSSSNSSSGSSSNKNNSSSSNSGNKNNNSSNSSNSSSGTTSKPSSSSNSSSNSSGTTNKPSSSNNSTTTAHKHSYTSKVTKAATCGSAGVRTYTCSCGDSYTESIPATGSHNWVAQTKTVHHDEVGHYETVTITAAWDEDIIEPRYVCNQCGYTTDSDEDMGVHLFSGNCQNYSTKRVVVGTKHHDAVTDTKWVVDQQAYDETVTTGYKCSVCGATK